jgi:hypothetical protein
MTWENFFQEEGAGLRAFNEQFLPRLVVNRKSRAFNVALVANGILRSRSAQLGRSNCWAQRLCDGHHKTTRPTLQGLGEEELGLKNLLETGLVGNDQRRTTYFD